MKILFHGASVTQQNGEGSYFHWVEKAFAADEDVILDKKGYGGCHFNDAGLVTIFTDVADCPDICILEWNTTSQADFDMPKLTYIASELVARRILPVFLILASEANTQAAPRRAEQHVIQFCHDNGLPCWDYRPLIDRSVHLRDIVHTNESGARIYADRLFADITALTAAWPAPLPHAIARPREYAVTSYTDFALDLHEGSTLTFRIGPPQPSAQIVASVVHGPASPIVQVGDSRRLSIWDRWSHYERVGLVTLWNHTGEAAQDIEVTVLKDAIDYSVCARPFSFNGTKILKIRNLHMINCTLNLIDLRLH